MSWGFYFLDPLGGFSVLESKLLSLHIAYNVVLWNEHYNLPNYLSHFISISRSDDKAVRNALSKLSCETAPGAQRLLIENNWQPRIQT